MPPGYTSALTYDSVRAILTANAKGFRSIDYQWERVQINPLSPDLAAYTGIVSGATVDTAGTTTRMVLAESGVVIRRKDGWKLLCGQSAHLPTPGRE
ncbi:MAG: nuclear transport factor 2 family protein [Lewinellaceae bacterium]|nr:nuclear transport factor 2 family protein [Lewinellaceae bacterium]